MAKSYPKPQKFIPKNPSKYIGDYRNIISRSGLETKFFLMCDNNPSIVKWNSEDVVIPYVSPLDNKPHRYFIDLYVENNKGEKFLVEIKPYSQTLPPKKTAKKRQRTLLNEVQTYMVNDAKWQAAKSFAEKNGCKFVIMTERDIK